MKILAIEKEIKKGRVPKAWLAKEAHRVYALYKKGVIREIYFHKKNHIAILMIEAKHKSDARKIISTLPLVSRKVIDFELMELIPYDGLDRIIK